jgi:hypothetical protein
MSTFNVGTFPVVLEVGYRLSLISDGFASGTLATPDAVQAITSSQTYEAGPYTVRREVVIKVDSGSVVVTVIDPAPETASADLFAFTTTSTADEIGDAATEVGTHTGSQPWGAGRALTLAPGLYECDSTLLISVNHTLESPAGSAAALIRYTGYPEEGQPEPGGPSGVITIAGDRLFNNSFVGRGEFRHLEIDGNAIGNDLAPFDMAYPVHGVYAPETENGIIQSIDYCRVSRCAGDGWHIVGRDQLISRRMKAGNNRGWGIYLEDVGDSKLWGTGSSGGSGDNRGEDYKSTGGALCVNHCATFSMSQFDLFVDEDTFGGDFVVKLINQTNARFIAGEMSGRVGILGRNNQSGGNEFEINNCTFENVLFKWAQGLERSWTFEGTTVSAYIYIKDADGVVFINPKFGGIDADDVDEMLTRPDYLWQFDSDTDAAHRGFARIMGGSGIPLRRSRLGDSKAPAMPCKKNLSNANHLLELDFEPGALVEIAWDDSNPPLNYVKAAAYGSETGATYNKADYPIGYLLANWNDPTKTLDDVATTFTVPPAPRIPRTGCAFAMRVWL